MQSASFLVIAAAMPIDGWSPAAGRAEIGARRAPPGVLTRLASSQTAAAPLKQRRPLSEPAPPVELTGREWAMANDHTVVDDGLAPPCTRATLRPHSGSTPCARSRDRRFSAASARP
mmetsp:Transcript_7891/g.19183  ORF Transcript_7891/g.19183 Transcript_7891/m.19183 type:complete len:117 (-) Transcript_7891:255-605(-)